MKSTQFKKKTEVEHWKSMKRNWDEREVYFIQMYARYLAVNGEKSKMNIPSMGNNTRTQLIAR